MTLNKLPLIALLLTGFTLPVSASASSLQLVKKYGAVRCGINENLPGFAEKNSKGEWSGLDVDLCRAVAAAVFSDASKVEYIPVSATDRFKSLSSGKFDILSRNTTWNLSRDTGMKITFTGVNYYDGQGFMVPVESGIRSALELNGSTICVEKATTHIGNLKDYFLLNRMKYKAKSFDSAQASLQAFEKGECDVITSDQSSLYSLRTKLKNPKSAKVLAEIISKEPLGPAVAVGNSNWAKIVRWSLFVMLDAEEAGISAGNVDQVRKISRVPAVRRLLGLEENSGSSLGLSKDWSYNIIKQVGNYADSFDRNVGKGSSLKVKRGLNALWRDGGLHYAPPID
ncbi:MAG: amino acid ABC transporter substrate-binding protein [Pseudomonadota bacterium]|nr:amino acid ABC transporter substrate-binding protein [Pseudomonadota bacterium]